MGPTWAPHVSLFIPSSLSSALFSVPIHSFPWEQPSRGERIRGSGDARRRRDGAGRRRGGAAAGGEGDKGDGGEDRGGAVEGVSGDGERAPRRRVSSSLLHATSHALLLVPALRRRWKDRRSPRTAVGRGSPMPRRAVGPVGERRAPPSTAAPLAAPHAASSANTPSCAPSFQSSYSACSLLCFPLPLQICALLVFVSTV